MLGVFQVGSLAPFSKFFPCTPSFTVTSTYTSSSALSPLSNILLYSLGHFVAVSNSKCINLTHDHSFKIWSHSSVPYPNERHHIHPAVQAPNFSHPSSYHSISNPRDWLTFPPKIYLIYLRLTISSKSTYYPLSPGLQWPPKFLYRHLLWPRQTILLMVAGIIFSKYKFTAFCLKLFNGFSLILRKQHKITQHSLT